MMHSESRLRCEAGPYLTTSIWSCRNPFSQWMHSFLWKLRSHWLKVLRQRHVAVVRQGPAKVTTMLLQMQESKCCKFGVILHLIPYYSLYECMYVYIYIYIYIFIYNCVFGSLISDVTCNYVSADGGRDGLWWPALPGHRLSYTRSWQSLLVGEPFASCMRVHFAAHISKWELVCKFGVIFHIFIISCLG